MLVKIKPMTGRTTIFFEYLNEFGMIAISYCTIPVALKAFDENSM